jgi:hypothetical protein
MKVILKNIELILSAAGLLVIFLVPTVIAPQPADYWKVVALTAIFVGALHGIIFWMIRQRQRAVREEAIKEIRLMLQDRINNALATIMVQTSMSGVTKQEEQLEAIRQSVATISQQLADLTDESLEKWKDRYGTAHTAATGAA